MFKKVVKNYKSKNTLSAPCEMDWCISPVLGKTQQVAVALNDGKTYEYACRYPVSEGAVVVIGRQLPAAACSRVHDSPNTGCMGQVTAVEPKLTIKREHAVEVDYVFISDPTKKELTQCKKFLAMGAESYGKTLQLDKNITPILPITYHIRKILAAASVLAHPKLVTAEDLEQARMTILEKKSIDADMLRLDWGPPEDIGINLAEIHIPSNGAKKELQEIGKLLGNHPSWDCEEGGLNEMSNILKQFASLDAVNDYVNKYAHLGAVSVMVRGGFQNMLEAYLSVEPLSAENLANARKLLKGVGHSEAYALLSKKNGCLAGKKEK